MTDNRSDRLESSFTLALRQYLSTEPNKYVSEDDNLRQVCRWFGPWLQEKLANVDGWGKYRTVDDIVPCTANRLAANQILLQGLLIWFDDTNRGEWKEPLSAAFRFPDEAPTLLQFKVEVGDADKGLAKCPYAVPHQYPYLPVDHWLFTFESS